MKETVQIIIFEKVHNRQNEFKVNSAAATGLSFDWFRLTPTRNEKILKTGAKQCLEYFNGYKWKHITGLYEVYPYYHCGDIDNDTAVISVHPENKFVKIAIFKGHRPKYISARKKKVIQFLSECIKNKG